MLSSQIEADGGAHDSFDLWEFALWLERVTERSPTPDYQPRHRADGDAV